MGERESLGGALSELASFGVGKGEHEGVVKNRLGFEGKEGRKLCRERKVE